MKGGVTYTEDRTGTIGWLDGSQDVKEGTVSNDLK